MAESLANFRATYPERRVMLIVGRFHVEHDGGTLVKFRQRRPQDRTCTVIYSGRPDGHFALDLDDAGGADIVVSGITPPEKPAAPASAPVAR